MPGSERDAVTGSDRAAHQAAAPRKHRPAPHIPPRRDIAHRIGTDADAVATAPELRAGVMAEARKRNPARRLPIPEIDRFSQSGLWAITVPKEFGGAGVSNVTLAEVIATIAAAAPRLGPIP